MMENQTTYLKDYQASNFQIRETHLIVEILSLEQVMVTNEMLLARQSLGDLYLDGEDLNLQALAIDGIALRQQDYAFEHGKLRIKNPPNEFKLMVITRLNPTENTALSGLYASRHLLCTQCEAQGFRRITYCLDRPDILSLFSCKIIANKTAFPVLLSNGNCQAYGDLDQGRHFVIWQDPFVKPSYLFALVAGDLTCIKDQFVTQTKRKVQLEIYVEESDRHLCAYAMQSIKDAMTWDEKKFGREYDLERYMVVAIKDFNMGAMENKGLNIFNSKYVLADDNTATDADILGIQSVIGHEYFHNWTGNRVTCRDWFQLSLKEGLTIYRDQSFSADMNDPIVARIQDVANLRRSQFPEDRSALAHPVQPKSYDEINNFYTATVYEKGGEIVRMYEVLLGKDGFRRGMDLYFERHDGQAVTIEDFLAAMADANHCDLSQFKAWYDVPGTPVLTTSEHYQDNKLIIHLHQSGKTPLMIPVRFAVYTLAGEKLALPEMMVLTEKQAKFEFDCPQSPVVVNYLQGFSAPVVLQRELGLNHHLDLLACEQDGFALWDLKQSLLIHCLHSQQPLPQRFFEIAQSWIYSGRFSPALLTELFRFPSYEEFTLGLNAYNPLLLAMSVQALEQSFAQGLHAIGLPELEVSAPESIGQRAWRHLCAEYHALVAPKDHGPKLYQAFLQAQNMSDRLANLKILVKVIKGTWASEALAQFYQDWQTNELVMDKWFALQASYGDRALVEDLLEHPLFSWTNPNKVRALLGSFSHNNPLHFHDSTGQSYALLAACVFKLDAINPQIAARLVTPLTRGEALQADFQARMQEALQGLMRHRLSPNLREMVEKSLVNGA